MRYVLVIDTANFSNAVYGPFARRMDAENAFHVVRDFWLSKSNPVMQFSIEPLLVLPPEVAK